MDVDTGVLIMRLFLGVTLALHGYNKVFGPGGLKGTEGWFAALGLRPAYLHARVAAATEIGAACLMVAGFLTAAAGAAFVGLMIVATLTDHRGKGFFVFKGGCEYTVLMGAMAVALVSIGPGRWSLDNALALDFAGTRWMMASVVVGAAAAAGLMLTCWRPATEPDVSHSIQTD